MPEPYVLKGTRAVLRGERGSNTPDLPDQREKQGGRPRDRPVMIRKNAGMAVLSFFHKLFTAVLYLAATVLSSVGITTLINKALRDLLFELITKTFFGN